MNNSSLHLLPLVNSDHVVDSNTQNQKVRSVLPFFGCINLTISSGVTIYRAYNNNDTPMVVFITFVYFGSFLLDYLFRLCQNLPPSSNRRNVKIGIWVLLSVIMLGFACEFSTFMSLNESLCFFGVVIGGNTFLFYAFFIWEVGNNSAIASIHHTCCNNDHKECYDHYKPLKEAKIVHNV
ncbi:hypothetical protein VNO77_35365 [Canavalia gladiata]|uniref:Uncharacterized protein n=1 Tax=Canavalia gladiata TaxID=3824 RepID=A0AAN9Q0A6_CANGL